MNSRRLAALTATIAVIVLEFTLYTSEPYPPRPGPLFAVAGALFICAMVLLHQMHAREWPGLARFGFAISALGLGLWIAGGTLRELQVGWGLFCAGLMAIGTGSIMKQLPVHARLLLPIGSLLFLEVPMKYLLGERTGGLTIFAAFGLGWLAVSILLFFQADRVTRPKPS